MSRAGLNEFFRRLFQATVAIQVFTWFLLTVVGTLAGVTIALFTEGVVSEKTAAWVQAFGSVGAIWAAIGLVWWQLSASRQLETEKRHADEVRRLKIVKSVLARSIVIAATYQERVSTGNYVELFEMGTDELVNCKSTLTALPFFEIPHADLVVHIISLQAAIERFGAVWLTFKDVFDLQYRFENMIANDVEELVDQIVSLLADALSICDEQISFRGQ